MNMISKFAAASIAALSLAAMAAPANAAVYISFDGVTDAFVDLDDGEINEIFGAQGGFASVFVQGNADTEGYGILHSTAVEVTAGSTAANLTVWITRTGLSQTLPGVFFSSTNNNNANGLTSTIEQFYSTTNQKYGGTSVGSVTKVGLGSNNLNDSFGVNLGNNYSWTQKYTITATSGAGGRSASPTALATAVPEPGTWALMIGGFAGAGAMLRSRRKVLAAV